MTKLVALVAKDFRLLWRDRVALVFLLVAPVVVISVAGFSLSSFYGSGTGGDGGAEYLLPVTDLDGSDTSRELVSALERAPGLRLARVDEAEGRRLVSRTNRAGATLVIPSGFGTGFKQGQAVRLQLWTDPVKHLEVLKIKAEVERVRAALVAVQVAGRIAVIEVLTHAGDADFEAVAEDASHLASRLLDKSVKLEETSLTSSSLTFNTFDQNVPGFSVTFLMLGMLLGVGLGLVDEREWGMLYRLAAGPVAAAAPVIAKVISRFAIGCAQMVILFVFGRVAFDISLGPSLPALGLVILGVVFAASTFGLLIAALAPSRDSVLPLGTIAIVGMAAVGGCWWPITIEPQWLQSLAHLFPTAWAMEAFNDLMLRGRELADVWPAILAMVVFGAFYLTTGAWIYLKREERSR